MRRCTKDDNKAPELFQVPIIGLVPIPNLVIDDVQVDFQMEVTATETEASINPAGDLDESNTLVTNVNHQNSIMEHTR